MQSKLNRFFIHINFLKAATTFFLILVFAVSVNAQEQVRVEVDTTFIRIGEQINYKITADKIEGVQFPKLKMDSLKKVEVVKSLPVDTTSNSYVKEYILTSFDSGQYLIPKQAVFINSKKHVLDSLLVNVTTVQVDTLKQPLFAAKTIQEQPIIFDDYKHIVYIVLAVLLVITAIVAFIIYTRKRRNGDFVKVIPPYEMAMQRLTELDEKDLVQQEKIKMYYSELTGILRTYIERELHIPALESTSDELMELIKDFNQVKSLDLPKDVMKNLQLMLQESDLVKFAKSKPDGGTINLHRSFTEEMINKLRPEPSEEDEKVEGVSEVEVQTLVKKKFPTKLVVTIASALIVGTLSYFGVKSLMSKAISAVDVPTLVQEMNGETPAMLDSESRLEQVVQVSDNSIQFDLTLVNFELGAADIQALTEVLKTEIVKGVKNSEQMKLFRDKQLTLIYNYKDKNGYSVTEIVVEPKDYEE